MSACVHEHFSASSCAFPCIPMRSRQHSCSRSHVHSRIFAHSRLFARAFWRMFPWICAHWRGLTRAGVDSCIRRGVMQADASLHVNQRICTCLHHFEVADRVIERTRACWCGSRQSDVSLRMIGRAYARLHGFAFARACWDSRADMDSRGLMCYGAWSRMVAHVCVDSQFCTLVWIRLAGEVS